MYVIGLRVKQKHYQFCVITVGTQARLIVKKVAVQPTMSQSESGIDYVKVSFCAINLTFGFHQGLSKVKHTAFITLVQLRLPFFIECIIN